MNREVVRAILGDDTETKGYLPFYSVDTIEEVVSILQVAEQIGEVELVISGGRTVYIEKTLEHEQSIDNLNLAGERFAMIHKWIKDGVCRNCGVQLGDGEYYALCANCEMGQ